MKTFNPTLTGSWRFVLAAALAVLEASCGGGYGGPSATPPAPTTHNATRLNAILQGHITTVVSHYAGEVYAWDVVNEAFNDNGTLRSTLWYDSPGIGFSGQGTAYIEQALKWARAADSSAKLFYNDYGAEQINAKSNAIYQMAQDFKNRGVPLDGIGFQAHLGLSFDSDPNTLASFVQNMQRFSALGLEIHITEFDVGLATGDAASFAAQGTLYNHLMTACRNNPSCKSFQTWGFTDAHSWLPNSSNPNGWPLPFDSSYNKKPAYTGLLNALGAGATLRQAGSAVGITMGAAAQPQWLSDGTPYGGMLSAEYSQLEPENAMKFGPIHPLEGSSPTDPAAYNFGPPDQLVAFAQTNNMKVRGHTLVWHQQLPNWLP